MNNTGPNIDPWGTPNQNSVKCISYWTNLVSNVLATLYIKWHEANHIIFRIESDVIVHIFRYNAVGSEARWRSTSGHIFPHGISSDKYAINIQYGRMHNSRFLHVCCPARRPARRTANATTANTSLVLFKSSEQRSDNSFLIPRILLKKLFYPWLVLKVDFYLEGNKNSALSTILIFSVKPYLRHKS